MIAYLEGVVIATASGRLVVAVRETCVGYEIATPLKLALGDDAKIWIWYIQRDGSTPILMGFDSFEARELAIKLSSVKGIGPASASGLVHGGGVEGVWDAIGSNDATGLAKMAKGVSKKKAEEIIRQLTDMAPQVDNHVSEARKALEAMGHQPTRQELEQIDQERLPHVTSARALVEEYLKCHK